MPKKPPCFQTSAPLASLGSSRSGESSYTVGMTRTHTIDAVMVERRAASFTKRSIKTDMKKAGLRLAMSMVDLTTLEGKDSPEKVRSLCRKAIQPDDGELDPPVPSVAAVCVRDA